MCRLVKCCGSFGQLRDRHFQLHRVFVNRHGFGHGQRQGDFGDFVRAGIETDEVDRVLREFLADERLHCHRHFLGRMEAVVAHHRTAHVQQHHGGAGGGAFVQMQFEIAFVEFDLASQCSAALGQAVACQGVVQRLMEIEFADGVAELVRLGAVDAFAVGTGGDFFVAVALAVFQIGEDFHQRLLLHLVDRTRREAELPFAVFIQHAIFQQLFEQIRLLLVFGILHHLLQRLHGLVAVFHDEFHQLVETEEFVLCGELFTVVFAVEVLHVEMILVK